MSELSVNHMLGIKELTSSDINLIFDVATNFKEVISRPIKKVPTLRDITVANLFFENSTRTKVSFELAEKRGLEPIQIALAYVLHQSDLIFPLIGPRTIVETNSSIEASKVELTAKELQELSQA